MRTGSIVFKDEQREKKGKRTTQKSAKGKKKKEEKRAGHLPQRQSILDDAGSVLAVGPRKIGGKNRTHSAAGTTRRGKQGAGGRTEQHGSQSCLS